MDNNPKSVRNPVQHLNEHADFITSQPDAGEADKRHKKGGIYYGKEIINDTTGFYLFGYGSFIRFGSFLLWSASFRH